MKAELLDELRTYRGASEREREMVLQTVRFLEATPQAFERAHLAGHITASAWVVDPGHGAVLLTHHRKLNRWLQFGGHTDGDPDIRRSALREAREESGLTDLWFATEAIYDVDVHEIPARPDEPAHLHYDVRFALYADAAAVPVVSAESHDVAWIPLTDLDRVGADASVLRLAAKTATLPRVRSGRIP